MTETKLLLKRILQELRAIRVAVEQRSMTQPQSRPGSQPSTNETVALSVGKLREKRTYQACRECFRSIKEGPCKVHSDSIGRELSFKLYSAKTDTGEQVTLILPPWMPKLILRGKEITAKGKFQQSKTGEKEFTIAKILRSE